MEELDEQIWVLTDSKAVVTVADTRLPADTGKVKKISKDGLSFEIKQWGEKNTLPSDREEIVKGNGHIGELIRTKRDFTLGGGLVAYRRSWVDGKEVREYVETPADIQAFFDLVNIDRYLLKACKNLLIHGNVWTEYIRNKGKEIIDMQCLESRHMRAEKHNSKGDVANYYWCGMWHKITDKDASLVKMPAFNKVEKQRKFVLHTGDDLLYDDYYYSPTWWASSNWALLANSIPEFHLSNILNGYLIRYHIQIPKGHFYDFSAKGQSGQGQEDGKTKAAAAKKEFKDRMDEFLMGARNAGKAVITEYDVEKHLGKEFSGIKITPIPVDLKDEALLKLFDAATKAITASQGLHPTLANVDTAGKLSSGSEMRNAYLVYVKTKTPVTRRILLEAINLVHRENGWDAGLHWDFRDIEITNLDQEKSGTLDPVQADPAQV